jgi:hypothetical protein
VLKIDFKDFSGLAARANTVATKIESCLFCKCNEQISKEYSKIFRDLLVGLKNDENTLIRRELIIGTMTAADFVNIDKTKLIPASLKLMREQSQKKYF